MKNKLATITLSLLLIQGESYEAFSSEQSHFNAQHAKAVVKLNDLPMDVIIKIISEVELKNRVKVISAIKSVYKHFCGLRIKELCFKVLEPTALDIDEVIKRVYFIDQKPSNDVTDDEFAKAKLKVIHYLYNFHKSNKTGEALGKYVQGFIHIYNSASPQIKNSFAEEKKQMDLVASAYQTLEVVKIKKDKK